MAARSTSAGSWARTRWHGGTSSTPATVDGRGSDRPPVRGAEPPGWLQALAALSPAERLAGLGALLCAAATLLPWYRAPVADLGKTPWGALGFALRALLLTVGAALVLLVQVGRGRRPPLPLHEGTLLAAAGVWSAVIIGFLMLDRPSTTIVDF